MKSGNKKSGWGRLSRHGFVTMAAVALSSCGISPKTTDPIPAIWPAAEKRKHDTLIVMLPGRGDRMDSLQAAGFLEPFAGQNFDVVAVDAHFGYYRARNLLPLLHKDIVLPARERGYTSIWMLGVSMGGLGSLLYANDHPGAVDGIILLAPYLGDPGLAQEIDAAGGLANWDPDKSEFQEHEVAVWNWIKMTRSGHDSVPVYLGYGESDRFANNYDGLQSGIDGFEVYTEDGGHNWATWSELWQRIAADLPIR